MKRSLLVVLGIISILSVGGWYFLAHLPFDIPKLQERRASLYPKEFAQTKAKYGALVNAFTKSHSDKVLCDLAKLFISEAKVTGEHPYYYPAALECIDEAEKLNSNSIEPNILRANVLLSLHRFAEARKLLIELVGTTRGVSGLYGMLCDANVEMGEYAQAVMNIDVMLSLRPGLDAYSRASYLREIHGDDEGAIQAMLLATKAGMPGTLDAAWAGTSLGNLYASVGDLTMARLTFEKVLNERPDYPFALAELAMVYHKEGNNQSALTLLKKAQSMMPEISFYEKEAEIEMSLGRKDRVLHLVREMEEMFQEDAEAGHVVDAERAIVYSRFNYKLDDALRFARAEYAQRPNNITALYALAYTQYKNGLYREAKATIKRAMRTGTKNTDIHHVAKCIERASNSLAKK